MKAKMVFILSALLICSALAAQNPTVSTKYSDSEIAALIQDFKRSRTHDVWATGVLAERFRQDFPNAHDVEWESNGEIFEVEFEIGRRDFYAFYDRDGNLLMFRQEIRRSQLPTDVRTAAVSKFPRHRIDNVYRFVKGTRTFYRVEMEGLRDHEPWLYIDANGQILESNPIWIR
jgi:hypothetical protein